VHADLPAAACRDYLLSARGFNYGRHQRDVHEAYLAYYAIYRRRVGMHLQGPPSNKQELSPGSDLLQAYLPSAACLANLVSARGFN